MIGYSRNAMVIRTRAATPLAVMPDVSDCTLRYSGGVTYLPDPADERNTALGDYTGAYAAEAFAALNPHLRYKAGADAVRRRRIRRFRPRAVPAACPCPDD